MRISELYTPEVLSVDASATLAAAAKLMRKTRVGALAVFDQGRPVGIISERDVTRAVAEEDYPLIIKVSAYMSAPPIVADINADERDIANRMLTAEIRHMPVVEDETVVGMVSMRDLFAAETWA